MPFDGSRPRIILFLLGSEPVACNPNGYPFLTSKQAIEYLLDQLPPDAVLVLREHPVMLSGEKSFALATNLVSREYEVTLSLTF